jgi:hypothetical protein
MPVIRRSGSGSKTSTMTRKIRGSSRVLAPSVATRGVQIKQKAPAVEQKPTEQPKSAGAIIYGPDEPKAPAPLRPSVDATMGTPDEQRDFITVSTGERVPSPAAFDQKQDAAPAAEANDPVAHIVLDEGRFDKKTGNLMVYGLPKSDGGGNAEIAGINEKYHPKELAKLVAMAPEKRADEARRYIREYTDDVKAKWDVREPSVEYFLRDSFFNRGPGGAAKILQIALGQKVDGGVGPKTKAALAEAEKNPVELIKKLRAAREEYERKHIGVRPDLWDGLVNRWDKVTDRASKMAQSKPRNQSMIGATLATF